MEEVFNFIYILIGVMALLNGIIYKENKIDEHKKLQIKDKKRYIKVSRISLICEGSIIIIAAMIQRIFKIDVILYAVIVVLMIVIIANIESKKCFYQ